MISQFTKAIVLFSLLAFAACRQEVAPVTGTTKVEPSTSHEDIQHRAPSFEERGIDSLLVNGQAWDGKMSLGGRRYRVLVHE